MNKSFSRSDSGLAFWLVRIETSVDNILVRFGFQNTIVLKVKVNVEFPVARFLAPNCDCFGGFSFRHEDHIQTFHNAVAGCGSPLIPLSCQTWNIIVVSHTMTGPPLFCENSFRLSWHCAGLGNP